MLSNMFQPTWKQQQGSMAMSLNTISAVKIPVNTCIEKKNFFFNQFKNFGIVPSSSINSLSSYVYFSLEHLGVYSNNNCLEIVLFVPTKLPTESTCSNSGLIGQCSIAMKSVLSTIQIVIPRSTKGSITTKWTHFLKTSHGAQQSHFKKMSANLYQPGGQGLWASSNSEGRQFAMI